VRRSIGGRQAASYVEYMRFMGGILRFAFALVFGFTSLAHGPAMTLRAMAADAPCHATMAGQHATTHPAADQAGHHQAAQPESEPPLKSQSGAQKVCPMPGCFLMIEPDLSAAQLAPLRAGRVEAALVPIPGALNPDPADPPPRLV
jgi:hypothetical protein